MKTKKCKSCKEPFIPYRSLQQCCSARCALDWSIAQRAKQDAKTLNERIKGWKQKNKTISQLINEARQEFQKWIRERDRKQPCISCGTMESRIWHGGHLLKAEIYTGLVFDEDNCHTQCVKCNYYLDGNEAQYFVGLSKRIGEERVRDLYAKKDGARIYKFTREELEQIKEKYKQLNRKNGKNI